MSIGHLSTVPLSSTSQALGIREMLLVQGEGKLQGYLSMLTSTKN